MQLEYKEIGPKEFSAWFGSSRLTITEFKGVAEKYPYYWRVDFGVMLDFQSGWAVSQEVAETDALARSKSCLTQAIETAKSELKCLEQELKALCLIDKQKEDV